MKFTSTAGPRQTKEVSEAISKLVWEGKAYIEVTGTIGGKEFRNRVIPMFTGSVRKEVMDKYEQIGTMQHNAQDGRKEVSYWYEVRVNSWAKEMARSKYYFEYTGISPASSGEAVKVEGITVSENEEQDGVEIRFPSKPAPEILEKLKGYGFRWSRYSTCWYKKRTPTVLAFARSLQA